jgi:hypothetical protein
MMLPVLERVLDVLRRPDTARPLISAIATMPKLPIFLRIFIASHLSLLLINANIISIIKVVMD